MSWLSWSPWTMASHLNTPGRAMKTGNTLAGAKCTGHLFETPGSMGLVSCALW